MKAKGMVLPQSFVEFARQIQPINGCCHIDLIENVDSFGNVLDTDLGMIFCDKATIVKETEDLSRNFVPDGFYGSDLDTKKPGSISDIVCFDEIVCFGISGDDAPFCFDFREDKNTPSIIWWDDIYWRKISDSFDDFLLLFKG
ncbi:hypothetical protein AGMMS49545_15800 [Betaproteobacteria bacterium]|nr:hypothetical protein AGMMS49545_15800 [Betaproteobacteria bacterium]GHU45252.1 hypothetical protein AGMMS50289_15980 [Betaproteobacteria bacterium]